MTADFLTRIDGSSSSLGMKAPVAVATTGPIVLLGLQTIDGEALIDQERVLVKDQANAAQNGIYIANKSLTTPWQRDTDFDGPRDAVDGTLVFVRFGTTNSNTIFRLVCTDLLISFGTSLLTFIVPNNSPVQSTNRIGLTGDILVNISPIGQDLPTNGLPGKTPLRTLTYAYNTWMQQYDLRGHKANFVVDSANGIYGENFTAQGRLTGQTNDTDVKFVGSPGIAVIQGSFNLNGRGCALSVQNMLFSAPLGASYGSPAVPSITIGNNTTLFVLSGITFGDNPGGIDMQPTFHSVLILPNRYTIGKSANSVTFSSTAGSAVIGVSALGSIQVGDVMTEVDNPSAPRNAINTNIQPFSKVLSINVGASQVTLDRVAKGNVGAGHSYFSRASTQHIQADQHAEVFYNQSAGTGAVINGVAAYTGGFVTTDLATYLSGELAAFYQEDIVTPAIVNGPSFIIFNAAVFDPGSASLTAWPGTVITITGTTTGGSKVLSGLSAADQAQVANYLNTYPNNFGLMITGAQLPIGQKIASAASLSGSNLTMTLPANGNGTATYKLGGFVYNNGIHQQNAPLPVD